VSRDRFLAASVELFEETGEWPKVAWVQRELVHWRDGTNARREARRLPRRFGDLDGDRLVLGVRAIHRAEPGSPVLETFRIALREAWNNYRRGDRQADALLSVADLVNGTSLSEFQAWQAMTLLAAEGLVMKSTERVWTVVPTIRHYRSVRTVEDYLRRRKGFELRYCLRRSLSKPVDLIRHALRPDGWVRGVILAALGILLAALLLWAGKELTSSSHAAKEAPLPHRVAARGHNRSNPAGLRAGRSPPARAGRR
jgi:hypothetical protein